MRNKPVIISLLFLSLAIAARAQNLKLIPYPRQVEQHEGRIPITARTAIAIAGAHAAEDRVGAEMLAEDIELFTGHKPRIVSGRGGAGAIVLERKAAAESEDPLFKEQGYTITASRERIVVAASTAAGVFYGVQTLRQLLVPEGKQLACPAVTIKDWPAMRWRGVHDDLSRGPIATLDFMKKQIRILSEYKINLFSPYMEAVFAYANTPLAAPPGAAMTPADARELVKYAARYHVVIVPEQEAFGHMHNLLRWEKYAPLAETPHGHVLAPVQPGSFDVIKSMFDELAQVFPGPFLHIGADETFELGHGQTKAFADQAGLGRVYLEFLQKIAQILQPLHKRIMFWGDIAMKYPQLLSILPKDVIAVAWKYDALPNFDALLKPYKDAGLDLFVAPGANNWNVIFPNLDVAYPNIAVFVRDGQKYGALGMLNTTWNDSGEALLGMAWPPLILGAACSWQAGECSIAQFQAAYDWAFYRNQDSTFTDAINNLNRANTLMKNVGLRETADDYMWIDPFSEAGARFAQQALPAMRDLRLAAEQALIALEQNRAKVRLHAETLDPLVLAGYRLDLFGMKVQFTDEMRRYYWDAYQNMGDRSRVRRGLGEISGTNGRLEDLREGLTRVRRLYSDAWLKENHPYWLGDVQVRYDELLNQVQAKINAIRAARRQLDQQGVIPPPEQMGFYRIPPPAAPAAK